MIFTPEIEAIRDLILQEMTIFADNGYIIQKGKEQRVKGITDNIRDYFYIDFQDGDGQIEMEQIDGGLKGAHETTGSFKIIGRAEGVNLQSVIYGIIACITNDCLSRITSASVDESLIFNDETGEDIPCDMALFRVEFEIEKVIAYDINCIDVTCKTESC